MKRRMTDKGRTALKRALPYLRKLGVEISQEALSKMVPPAIRMDRKFQVKLKEKLALEGRAVVVFKNGNLSLFSAEGWLKHKEMGHSLHTTKKAWAYNAGRKHDAERQAALTHA